MMYKYTIARQLATKRVITNRGDEVGRLTDILVNENTGELETLLVEADRESKVLRRIGANARLLNVPYASVTAVSDVFIVDERELAAQLAESE